MRCALCVSYIQATMASLIEQLGNFHNTKVLKELNLRLCKTRITIKRTNTVAIVHICISDRYSASCVAILTAIQAFESTININHGILIANSCRQFTNNVQVGSNNQVKHVRTKL